MAVWLSQCDCRISAARVDPHRPVLVARILTGSKRTDYAHGEAPRRIHRSSPGSSPREHHSRNLVDAVADSCGFELLAFVLLDRSSQRADRCLASWLADLYRRDGRAHSAGLVVWWQDPLFLLAVTGSIFVWHVGTEKNRLERSLAADRGTRGWYILEATVEGSDHRSAADIMVSTSDLLGEPAARPTLFHCA